jgi:polyisoprenoid-binding protein YceI
MKVTTLLSLSVLLASVFASPVLLADLSLNKDASQVNFVSVKNEHIAEIHSFDEFSGSLSTEGKLQIDINLMSVNTLIPIRNERMQKMLFDASNFAVATFVADIDKSLASMPIGSTKNVSINGELTIKDKIVPVTFLVNITSLENGKVNATTIKPTIISASQFDLDGGINALQEIAMLKSISRSVPLTFSVTFQ